MKKLLALIILGLLWGNSSYAKNITLNKCKDTEYDSLMYEKYYYIIDLKKKEITNVVVYDDKYFKEQRGAFAKDPVLKKQLNEFKKINTSKTTIYFNDKNYIKSKSKKNYSNAIEKTEIDIDLKERRVFTRYNLFNKIKQETSLDSSSEYQCVLNK